MFAEAHNGRGFKGQSGSVVISAHAFIVKAISTYFSQEGGRDLRSKKRAFASSSLHACV